MYIATTYIGTDYMPGETLPDGLPQEFIERLLKSGAVQSAAPVHDAPEPTQETGDMTEEESRAMTRENYARQLNGMGYDPGGNPLPQAEQDAEAQEDEIDEDEVAPEIDVMDGIVKDKPNPTRKSRAERSRKAPKGGKTE